MTEHQIRNGYEQLDSALAPPPDVHERVARRVAVRRRRRRVAVAGGAMVGLAAVAGTVVVGWGGAGEDPDRLVAVDPPAEPSGLVLTRPDGSTYEFTDLTVSCEEPEVGGSFKPGEGIWLQSPIEFQEGPSGEDEQLEQPFVFFEGRLDALQEGRTFTLPEDAATYSEEYTMALFVADTEGARDGNEVTSSESDSSGTVRVLRASCDPEPVLELEVDATLGSEEGKQPLDIAGSAG